MEGEDLEKKVIAEHRMSADFVVVGGGLSGLMAAVAAARHGCKVILIQDRPVLGGNASSEIRMGICGAHGKGRKETGLLEELQLNNIYRNPLMRYTLWDDVMYSFALAEDDLTLLLNTSVQAVQTESGRIRSVTAWNGNEYCRYQVSGTLFADCSGDGILALSGAEFRIGREKRSEFSEDFLEDGEGDSKTMGNSILLQLRKTDEHHPFKAPVWAHHYDDSFFAERVAPPEQNGPVQNDQKIQHSHIRAYPEDNNFWWIEYGGAIDTIHDAGNIGKELKKIAYGVWEYMKNHPDGRCRNYELDWIGSLPGKRESRRFVGDHILNQHDVMDGGQFPDNVCYGGWTLDNHHPDAFMHPGYVSTHHVPPSPFGIPYRCLYSRNVENLFFAGRNVSCTHMGLSSIRVMATCALMGQAVGSAAALALRYGVSPRTLGERHVQELQDLLLEDDVMIPGKMRQVSPLTLQAETDFPLLKTSVDRNMDETDNGVWLSCGVPCEYRWKEPVSVSGCRIVFDTLLSYEDKRMRKLEALSDRKEMPAMLAKKIRIEYKRGDDWVPLLTEDELHCRLFRRTWETISTTAIRLTVDEVWGQEPKAHLFTVEYR